MRAGVVASAIVTVSEAVLVVGGWLVGGCGYVDAVADIAVVAAGCVVSIGGVADVCG